MKLFEDYVFLSDDINPNIDVKKDSLFGRGDWVEKLLEEGHKYNRKTINIKKQKLSQYNGVDKFILSYNCYWHQNWYKNIHKLNPMILNGLKNNTGKIIFINHLEGQPLVSNDTNLNFLEPMYKTLKQLNIPPKNIIYISANAKADFYHDKWCEENNIKNRMNIIGIFTDAITAQKEAYKGRLNKHTFNQHLNILKNKTNVKYFIKVHRNDRHFKTIITHDMWRKNLQDKLYTSHTEYARHGIGYPDTNSNIVKDWLNDLHKTKSDFEKTLPYTIEDTCEEQIINFDSDRDYTNKIYTLNLFNIYPSSWPLWKDTIFMRMGLFWHMWEYQPFILYSNVGSLKLLKQRGYETFSEIFDETYDEVEDNGLRLKMVCEEIEKISRLSLDQAFNVYESVQDKLIHNRNQLEKNIELDRFMEFFYESI